MNYKMMGRFIGHILLVESVFMVPALLISLFKHEQRACVGFVSSLGITMLLSLLLLVLCRGSKRSFKAREGLVCVSSSWVVMSLLGSVAFLYIKRDSVFSGCAV